MATFLFAAPAAALTQALSRQRRWEHRNGLTPYKAVAPKGRPKGGKGAKGKGRGNFRTRAYVRARTVNVCDEDPSDDDSVVSEGDKLSRSALNLDDASSASGSSDGNMSTCGPSDRRSKRLVASSSASSCSSRSGTSSLSSIAEFNAPAFEDQEDISGLEEYALSLRPLIVTRAELVKIIARMPPEVLNGPQAPASTQAHVAHRELLEALCSSIACVARPDGPTGERLLCLGDGYDYIPDSYSLSSNVRTRLVIVLKAIVPAGSAPRGAEGQDAEAKSPEARVFTIRVTEVASRELFIAELMAMEDALRAGMEERFSSSSSLKRRRRTLRHVADAIKVLRPKRSSEPGSGLSRKGVGQHQTEMLNSP